MHWWPKALTNGNISYVGEREREGVYLSSNVAMKGKLKLFARREWVHVGWGHVNREHFKVVGCHLQKINLLIKPILYEFSLKSSMSW